MRGRGWIGVAVLVGATFAGVPVARADGGAYLDLDRTHYLPGQTARFEGYVSIPRAKQDLIERGPFYVFVVPPRTAVTEGRPIPAGRRSGRHRLDRAGPRQRLRAARVVRRPRAGRPLVRALGLQRPVHDLGFREPLTGTISIVATAREGALLTEISRLNGRNWSLRRQVRKSERANLETSRAAHGRRDRALGAGEPGPRAGIDRAAGAAGSHAVVRCCPAGPRWCWRWA